MALFTTTDYKTHEGITTSEMDSAIAQVADAVSAAIDRYCRRTLLAPSSDSTIYLDGTGTPDLFLPNYPIISLTGVWEDYTRAFDSSSQLTEGTDFITYKEAGILRKISLSTGIWATPAPLWIADAGVIKVTYRAGYESSNLPDELKEAAILWAASILSRRGAHGHVSRSLGPHSEAFSQAAIPPQVAALLAPFRRWPQGGVHS